jgi:GH43 family beta-xylosidase
VDPVIRPAEGQISRLAREVLPASAMPRPTYTNPVSSRDFADPFVLRFQGRYYAWGTGPAADGRYFPMMSSPDLVHWTEHGGALAPLDLPGAELYWAPEVAVSEGVFHLYYAVGRGDDPDHHLRPATAPHPLGPWQDAGLNLAPHELFAIDGHPFRDPADGRWYLFYARDRLEPPYAGTGVVVDRLLAMDRLEGCPREVRRPACDWMVFELRRAVKKDLDWYTAEGPFVLRVDGRYVCFYSGGRWEHPNYGVGYALADHPLGPWTDDANTAGPQVLTTDPGRVVSPGHNSVVTGPDLLTPYIVYHAWNPDLTARTPRIDRLAWQDGRPYVPDGPSTTPRPVPSPPDIHLRFEEQRSPASLPDPLGDFVAEASVRWERQTSPVLALGPVEIGITDSALQAGPAGVPLSAGFDPGAWHTLHLRREAGSLTVTLDEYPTVQALLPPGALRLAFPNLPGLSRVHLALTRLQSSA